MSYMFRSASAFNHPLNSWQVGQVTTFRNMFDSASAFNQDISAWNVSQATSFWAMTDMFSVQGSGAFGECNTMALDTSTCPNVAVHNSFESQTSSGIMSTAPGRT